MTMQLRWLVIVFAALGIVAAEPALARAKHKPHQKSHKVNRSCVDRPQSFTWSGFWFNPHPQPNGCAPPVYVQGEYVGQDPDANIRAQLRRDPESGYAYDLAH
jgi:hypothetical protein